MRPMAASMQRALWRQLPQAPVTQPLQQRILPSSTATTTTRRAAAAHPSTWSASAQRSYTSSSSSSSSAPPPPPPPPKNTIKFWPFLAMFGISWGSYVLLVNKRQAEMPAIESAKQAGRLAAPPKSQPTFSADDVTVIFVLGGPGAGKGTQCARLVKEYGFSHLSAGDLLRAEQERPGSEFGELIKQYIRDGAIVPMEVTVQLLENAMTEVINNNNKTEAGKKKKAKFLIDGFPRKMDQALKFEEAVCPAKFVLFYDCPEQEMERRLLERGKTSGRADDNAESIRKRFRTFIDTSMPVVDHYEKEGRVVKIDATPKPDSVFKETRKNLMSRLGSDL